MEYQHDQGWTKMVEGGTIVETEQSAGVPFPLGVSWIAAEDAWNFALYSKHAQRVTLLLYGADDLMRPLLSRELDFRRHKSGPIWHCRVPRSQAPGARFYACRVDGEAAGTGFDLHSFDAEKLLVDPYARSIFFPPASIAKRRGSPDRTKAARRWPCWTLTRRAVIGATTVLCVARRTW